MAGYLWRGEGKPWLGDWWVRGGKEQRSESPASHSCTCYLPPVSASLCFSF